MRAFRLCYAPHAAAALAAANSTDHNRTTGDLRVPQSRKRRTGRRTHTRGTNVAAQQRSEARHAKQKRTRLIAIVIIVALVGGLVAAQLVEPI